MRLFVLAFLAGALTIFAPGMLARLPSSGALEQRPFEPLHLAPAAISPARATPVGYWTAAGDTAPAASLPPALPALGVMPPLDGATQWLNSPPLTPEALRGKVVVIDFWTFACVNCRNALPYVRGWYQKYKDQGLVVIGVHAPEFAFEKNVDNVQRAMRELGIAFPVAIDNNFSVWRAFDNQYWPAHYFIDARGRIRFRHFGEGEYEKSEQVIRQLLEEAHKESQPT